MGDDLVPLMGFTLNVTARPALQAATLRHKSLTDSLMNRGETWQSGEAHQYYSLIQINETQFNRLKCVKDSTSCTRGIVICDFFLTPVDDCSSVSSGCSHCTHPESLLCDCKMCASKYG